MPYVRKTEDEYTLQGYFSHRYGWEDLAASKDRKEVRNDLKSYRENAPGTPYRIIKRRIPKASISNS